MDYPGILAANLAIFAGTALIGILGYVVGSVFLSMIFAKAGVEGTWRAWVPVYNMMVFFKLGDLSPWLVLYGFGGAVLLSWIGIGFLFSLALFVASGLAAYRIGLKLQTQPVWVVLWLIPIVWLGVMAFNKAHWNVAVAPAQWAGNAFLGDRTVWQGLPAQRRDEPGHLNQAAWPQPEYPQ
ncbi:hypothetical protein GCM10023169_40820 [Georgenia halophila]|uniref:Uncharacterized protein n=1 Tax=Georgenia halophila TaxID=620889 RepID=A0ABP8LPM0_9MICO